MILAIFLMSFVSISCGEVEIPAKKLVGRAGDESDSIEFSLKFAPAFGAVVRKSVAPGMKILSAVILNDQYVLIHSVQKHFLSGLTDFADLQYNYVVDIATSEVVAPRLPILSSVLGSDFRGNLLLAMLEEQFRALPFPPPSSSEHKFSSADIGTVKYVMANPTFGILPWTDDEPLPSALNQKTGKFVWKKEDLKVPLEANEDVQEPAAAVKNPDFHGWPRTLASSVSNFFFLRRFCLFVCTFFLLLKLRVKVTVKEVTLLGKFWTKEIFQLDNRFSPTFFFSFFKKPIFKIVSLSFFLLRIT
jgi:hypothetical protein